ncbi:MAG: type VI secretion system protein TssA [Gemmataceae bacterium]|nr:type VI secretion system protein TssA [Gemmataceae bacterium]
MASPPILDLDALVAPIPGSSPAGVPLPYDTRLRLEDLRKEINPDDYDPDDPRRPTEYRKPNWSGIVELASETLTRTSKDLLVAARLVEAVAIERGIPGLRDGLALLRRLVDECWDRVFPRIEEGDTPEVREGPFKWLNQAAYGALFPMTVRALPLVRHGGSGYSVLDWQDAARRPRIESCLAEVPEPALRDLLDDLTAARENLKQLERSLNERMREFAPDFTSSENPENLGAALADCWKIAQQWWQRKQSIGSSGSLPSGSNSDSSGTAAPMMSGLTQSLATRADAYRMLNQAADLLQTLEPHSPIPYLVKRAVRLGELKFPELMRALIRESAVLDELDRLMGLDSKSE